MSNPYDTPNMTDAGRIQQETPEDRHRDVLDETFPPGTNPRLAAWAAGTAAPLSDSDYDAMAGVEVSEVMPVVQASGVRVQPPAPGEHVHGTPETGYVPINPPPAPMPEDVVLHDATRALAPVLSHHTPEEFAALPIRLQERVIDSTDDNLRRIEAAGYRIVPVL